MEILQLVRPEWLFFHVRKLSPFPSALADPLPIVISRLAVYQHLSSSLSLSLSLSPSLRQSVVIDPR